MKRISLSPQGPALSPIVYGAWRLLDAPEGAPPARVRQLVEVCLEYGISTFDHADLYGGYGCEEAFGRALQEAPHLRQRLQLVSKCGIKLVHPARPAHRLKSYDTSKEHILTSVRTSLQALRTDHLDVLLIHRPDPLCDPDEWAEACVALHDAGDVRHFGVSNFSARQFELMQSRLPFTLCTNQIELSVLRPEPLFDGTTDVLQKARIRPMAWSPFGGGKLFTGDDPRTARVRAALEEVAAGHAHAGLDTVALAWLLRHPAGIVPIVGTGNLERIRSAAAALRVELTREEWFAILAASQGHAVA